MSSLEEELEATKSRAQLLMMAQGSEISNSIIAAGSLADRLQGLYTHLQGMSGQWQVEEEVWQVGGGFKGLQTGVCLRKKAIYDKS